MGSVSMPRSICIAVALLSFVLSPGCGVGPYFDPPPLDDLRSTGATQGQGCAPDAPCAQGLECTNGVCQARGCSHAIEPLGFCAAQLGLDASEVRCVNGRCEELLVPAGQSCAPRGASDVDQESQRTCQPLGRGCSEEPDPDSYCASQLQVDASSAECRSDVCAFREPAGQPCAFDSQCDGSLCVRGVCTRPCFSDRECSSFDVEIDNGTRCLLRPDPQLEGRVCQRPCALEQDCPEEFVCAPTGSRGLRSCQRELSCAQVLEPDGFCAMQLGVEPFLVECVPGVLGQAATCRLREDDQGDFLVLVDDSSASMTACQETLTSEGGDDLAAPGTDLLFVGISEDGAPLLPALVTDQTLPSAERNDFEDRTRLHRDLMELDAALCPVAPDPSTWPMLSLGCGGARTFQLVDGVGTPVDASPQTTFVVREYVELCVDPMSRAPQEDVVRVYHCPLRPRSIAPLSPLCVELVNTSTAPGRFEGALKP
ncbi:MAG: hypothetical protein AAGI01_06755 [Myxococcota bacterium]